MKKYKTDQDTTCTSKSENLGGGPYESCILRVQMDGKSPKGFRKLSWGAFIIFWTGEAMKKTFIFYSDRIDYTENMSNEEKWVLFQAILDYQNGKEITNDNVVIRMIFPRIQKQLDEDMKKRQEEKNKRSEAWKKGMEKRWGGVDNSVIKNITKHKRVKKTITKITDNVNDWFILEDISLIEEYEEVREFIDIQKTNITWVKYQIDEKWNEYYKIQYEEYKKLLKDVAKKNLTRKDMATVLKFISEDSFRKTNIGSIIKLRSKNKEWVPYRVVMIGQMQKKLQSQRPVYDLK